MNGQTAYEAYKASLNSRTRPWYDLKSRSEHEGREAAEFDQWLKENKPDELTRFFMGDYELMPSHSREGWEAFAAAAIEKPNEPAEAWNSYASKADLNFHKDRRIPFFEQLATDQKDAIKVAMDAVAHIKPPAPFFGP